MKVIYELEDEPRKSLVKDRLKGLINYINKVDGDMENLKKKYKSYNGYFTWYKDHLTIVTLFSPVPCHTIGYAIDYRGYSISVDNELNEIRIM